jgi:glycosyltransferase involved in cell wall biosynthesis
MRILINATSTVIGGGIQKTCAFLAETQRDSRGHEWYLAASEQVAQQVSQLGIDVAPNCQVFKTRPSQDKNVRAQVKQLARSLEPDCIYTINGPAYVQFDVPHLLGFFDPWVTHSTWLAYRQQPFPLGWSRIYGTCLYKRYWTRRADAWTTQTETAKEGLHRRLGLPKHRIAVVANTCARRYRENMSEAMYPTAGRKIRVLCFGAFYPHKRLHFAIHVAAEIKKRNPSLPIEFVLTVPEDHSGWKRLLRLADALGVRERIVNIGPVSLDDGPDLYKSCDLCFMPTVLETFSATYPEAMAMGLPIVTTDLDFLRDVCGDAALYFRPNGILEAADRILELLSSRDVWQNLIAEGKSQLERFPSPEDQYHSMVDVLDQMRAGRPIMQNPCDL